MLLFDLIGRPDATVLDVLDFQAENNATAIWLRQDERQLTFAEARTLVDRYAAGLSVRGLRSGQMLALVVSPSIDVVLLCLAAARLGAVFTTVNTDFKGEFLREAVDDTLAQILIIDAELAERWAGVSGRHVRQIFVLGEPASNGLTSTTSLLEPAVLPLLPTLNAYEPLQIWWSSGTTGKSKGVMHGHSSILRLAWRLACAGIQAQEVLYSCTPMYLGSSWTGTIWPSLVAGVGGAIDARFSATQFWQRIAHYDATYFFTLGAMHMHLWKREPSPAERSHRIRRAQAIPLTWDQVPQFKQRFGIQNLPQSYGTSETFVIFEAPDDGTPWQGAALGRAVEHYDVKLMDDSDREVPSGEAGEICVRPREPGVMFLGYYQQPEMTAKTWRNLWHHTGDMATRDADGIYYFADRKKDYIRYNGRNISMFEVEAVADRHPEVADVCAYGIVSEELASESELCLAILPKPGCAPLPDDIARFINRNAPYYFVPRYIITVANIPRNAHGRIMKNELRDRGVPAGAWDRKISNFVVER